MHQAHLAHAKGQTDRAKQCYEVAEVLAAERGDDFVRISARAGNACITIGLVREKEEQLRCDKLEEEKRRKQKRNAKGKGRGKKEDDAMDVDAEMADELNETVENEIDEWESVQKLAEEVAEECRGMGGTMWGVGRVIEACLTEEILKSKYA